MKRVEVTRYVNIDIDTYIHVTKRIIKRSFSSEMNMSCVLHMYYACNKFYGSTLMQEVYNYHRKQFLLV